MGSQGKQKKKLALHYYSYAGLVFVDKTLDSYTAAGVPRDGYTTEEAAVCAGEDLWGTRTGGSSAASSVTKPRSRGGTLHTAHRTVRPHWFREHGHGPFTSSRSYGSSRAEPLHKTKTGYYDVLEVSPSATHAQIKTAYYKQSFAYHPDRNAGSDEATVRFSEISEAYTVLGNKALRKKYDRGLLSLFDLTAGATRPSASGGDATSAKAHPGSRRSVVGTDIRGGVFDFDKFYKNHYGEQLQRERDIRVRREEMLRRRQQTAADWRLGKNTEIGVALLFVMAVGLFISLK